MATPATNYHIKEVNVVEPAEGSSPFFDVLVIAGATTANGPVTLNTLLHYSTEDFPIDVVTDAETQAAVDYNLTWT